MVSTMASSSPRPMAISEEVATINRVSAKACRYLSIGADIAQQLQVVGAGGVAQCIKGRQAGGRCGHQQLTQRMAAQPVQPAMQQGGLAAQCGKGLQRQALGALRTGKAQAEH